MRSIIETICKTEYLLLSVSTPDNYIVLLALHALVLHDPVNTLMPPMEILTAYE